MRKYTSLAFTLVAALSTMSAAAQAPQSSQRHGFYIGGGFGYGSAGMTCDGCTADRTNGMSGYLKLGGTLNPHLRLGVESNGWYKSEDGVDQTIGFFSGDAYWYPSVSNNFYLKGGVGYSRYKASGGGNSLETNGVGAAFGAGYDFQVAQSLAVTPFFNYLRQFSGQASFNGESLGQNGNANVFQFGVGIGYQH
jgi:hypothetical protein